MAYNKKKAKPASGAAKPARAGERDRIVERVVRRLTQDIMDGAYGPGERIRETEVSTRLGISRSPVREALNVLQSRGMVELIPWRGARVINLSPNEIADLFDLLATCDGAVARLAARNASDEDLARYADKVQEAVQALETARDTPTESLFPIVQLTYQAGAILADCCGSAMAANMVRTVGTPAYWLHHFLTPSTPRWLEQALVRQARVRDALFARDEDRSEKAARALVQHARTLVVARARKASEAQASLHRMSSWDIGRAVRPKAATPPRARAGQHRAS